MSVEVVVFVVFAIVALAGAVTMVTARNPVSSALRYFGPEFDAHILDRECPTGVCLMPRFSPAATRR